MVCVRIGWIVFAAIQVGWAFMVLSGIGLHKASRLRGG